MASSNRPTTRRQSSPIRSRRDDDLALMTARGDSGRSLPSAGLRAPKAPVGVTGAGQAISQSGEAHTSHLAIHRPHRLRVADCPTQRMQRSILATTSRFLVPSHFEANSCLLSQGCPSVEPGKARGIRRHRLPPHFVRLLPRSPSFIYGESSGLAYPSVKGRNKSHESGLGGCGWVSSSLHRTFALGPPTFSWRTGEE